jgi:tetratricopeptide (TPR) repeat protein
MEELCFALKENAFLLDTKIMSDTLLAWIGTECGLTDLSGELHPLIHKKGSLSAFVVRILEYVGFYDGAVVRQVEQTLKRGAGLNLYEKRKCMADQLIRKKKYGLALAQYETLLREWEKETAGTAAALAEGIAVPFRAELIHNQGVALAGLMLYEEAAGCFLHAYEADGSQDSYLSYLAAKRMEMKAQDYIAFVADRQEDFSASLQLEQTMKNLQRDWRETPEFRCLRQRQEWKETGETQKYYEENERIVQTLKDQYRRSV